MSISAGAVEAPPFETLFRDGVDAARGSSQPIVASLSAVRGHAGAVTESANLLVEAIGDIQSAATATQSELDPLTLLSSALAATLGLLESVSALQTVTLDEHLAALGKQTVTMRMISTCLKVDVAQIGAENSGFAEFSATYAAFSQRLVTAVAQANAFGAAISRNIDRSRMNLAGEVARQRQENAVVEDLITTHEATQKLGADVTRTLQDRVEHLLHATRSAIAELLRCLQFLDAFAQRLDNALRIIAACEGLDAESAALARTLACQQLRGLLSDTRATRKASDGALSGIHELARRARQDLAGGSGFGTQLNAWIASQSHVSDAIGRCAADTRVALEHVFSVIDNLDTESATMMAELSQFADLAKDFRVVGTNGVVAAAHLNASTGSVSSAGFLARETGVVAEAATDILVQSSGIINELRRRIAELDKRSLSDTVAGVRAYNAAAVASVEAFQAAKAAADRGMGDLGAALGGLRRACEEARSIEDQYLTMELHLESVISMLHQPGVMLAATDALDWVWPFYTTDDERKCHTALLGPRPAPTGVEEEDALDDFLL